MAAITDIVRPLPNAIVTALQSGVVPDRILSEPVICAHLETTPDGDVPCGWEGIADIAVFLDTSEALWWCPAGHENGWSL